MNLWTQERNSKYETGLAWKVSVRMYLGASELTPADCNVVAF